MQHQQYQPARNCSRKPCPTPGNKACINRLMHVWTALLRVYRQAHKSKLVFKFYWFDVTSTLMWVISRLVEGNLLLLTSLAQCSLAPILPTKYLHEWLPWALLPTNSKYIPVLAHRYGTATSLNCSGIMKSFQKSTEQVFTIMLK